MARGPLTDAEIASCAKDGYVLAHGLFDHAEIDLLREAAKHDKALDDHAFGRADSAAGQQRFLADSSGLAWIDPDHDSSAVSLSKQSGN
jgi:hypothetical protein